MITAQCRYSRLNVNCTVFGVIQVGQPLPMSQCHPKHLPGVQLPLTIQLFLQNGKLPFRSGYQSVLLFVWWTHIYMDLFCVSAVIDTADYSWHHQCHRVLYYFPAGHRNSQQKLLNQVQYASSLNDLPYQWWDWLRRLLLRTNSPYCLMIYCRYYLCALETKIHRRKRPCLR